MQLTTLGGSGLRVSRIGLGCSRLGSEVRGKDAHDLVASALHSGITLFDTADVYADGESEIELGRALGGHRDQAVVATKVRHARPAPGASRKSLRVGVEASLRRLGTDYIDVLQIHAPDPSTPLEETVHALQNLVDRGHILYYGLANVAAWQVADAQHIAWSSSESALLSSVQVQLNLIDSRKWRELHPVADRFGVGVLAASPLARGLLGGSYDCDHRPPNDHPLLSSKGVEYWTDVGLAIARGVERIARQRGWSSARTAVAAVLAKNKVTSALVGARSIRQLDDVVSAGREPLNESEVRELWALADRPRDRTETTSLTATTSRHSEEIP